MRAPGDGAVRRIVAAAWPRRTSAAQPRGPGQQTLSQRRSPRTTQAKSLLRAGLGDDHGFGRLLPDNASERHERDGVVEQSTSTDPGSSRFNACPSHPAPEAGVGSGDDPGVSAARAAASTADSDAARSRQKLCLESSLCIRAGRAAQRECITTCTNGGWVVYDIHTCVFTIWRAPNGDG